jgi:hypothetical protein
MQAYWTNTTAIGKRISRAHGITLRLLLKEGSGWVTVGGALVLAEAVTIAVVKDVALSVAAIVAAFVGLRGLDVWRRQLRGNTEYQLAKHMLVAVYELREAIAGARNPFMQYSRAPDLPQEKLRELSEKEKEWHALAQAYQRRWEPISTAKAKLDASLLEAEVVWGSEIRTKANPLNRLIAELLFAIQETVEARNPSSSYESPGPELVKKRHDVLYGGYGETDEFKERLDRIIGDVENTLRPHIVQYHR